MNKINEEFVRSVLNNAASYLVAEITPEDPYCFGVIDVEFDFHNQLLIMKCIDLVTPDMYTHPKDFLNGQVVQRINAIKNSEDPDILSTISYGLSYNEKSQESILVINLYIQDHHYCHLLKSNKSGRFEYRDAIRSTLTPIQIH